MEYSAWFTIDTGMVYHVVYQECNGYLFMPLFSILTRSHSQRSLDCGVGPF